MIRQGANVGVNAAFLRFSRRDESEADYLGVQYLYAAGYDPTGAISIFEKLESLERKQPGTVALIFSTHPMDATRIEKTEQEIELQHTTILRKPKEIRQQRTLLVEG